jgi:hypothetical protein
MINLNILSISYDKKKVGNQIANLTLDHKKSRISLISLRGGGVQVACYIPLESS